MADWMYFTTAYAIAEHDWYYPTFEEKLCHLVFSVIKLHAFNDGNKRSSLVLGGYFLEINGYGYCVRSFTQRMENIVVWVAEGSITKELLQKLIASILLDDEFSESLKLELLEAVS